MKVISRNIGIGTVGVIVLFSIFLVLYIVGTKINTKTLPKGTITLTTPYQTYLIGEEVTFTIHNNFNSSIILKNNCPTEPLDVFRYENDAWVRIHDTADEKACLSSQRTVTIPANGQRDATFAYWPRLFDKPGKYRIVAYVDYYEQLPYADFEIIEKPLVQAVQPNTSSTISQGQQVPISQSTNQTTSPMSSRARQTITLEQGTIIAEYDTQNIYIQSITPSSGWRYEGGKSGRQVEITFKRSEQEIKVKLQIRNGTITYIVEQDED